MNIPKTLKWSIIHKLDGDHLCIVIRKDEVIMVSRESSVYYPYEEKIDPTTAPEINTLASILSGVPIETLHDISLYCAEPRTMTEVNEKYPGVEAGFLRHLGFLVDTGKRGRKVESKWQGYEYDDLVARILTYTNGANVDR